MPLTYPWKDCPWVVRHKLPGDTHLAWRMRAFMLGDFQRKRASRNDYVINRDDTPGDWRVRPTCETCGVVPKTEDLVVIERSSGDRHFLDDAERQGFEGNVTRDHRCRWCQDPRVEVDQEPERLCPTCRAEFDRPAAVAPVEVPPSGPGFAPGDPAPPLTGGENTGPLVPPAEG